MAESQPDIQRSQQTLHNAALAALVICPALALLPPRKLDIYTAGLVGMTGFSGNYLHRERYGQSIWQRLAGQDQLYPGRALPTDRAREFQKQMKEQRPPEKQDILQQVWMGGESADWKEKRERETQEALAQGKGYGDMIMDQIWDVWNWGKKTDESNTSDDK